jgi:hypothetical protein
LNNCTLIGNSSGGSNSGGGASGGTLNNCLLIGNSTSGSSSGGGAYNSTLNNCTVISNSAIGFGSAGGATAGTLNNCITYYNTNTSLFYPSNNYNRNGMNYCCTDPLPGGRGNFTNAPLFVDPAGGNFHLQNNSPCINAGNNSYVTTTTDLDNHPRIKRGTVDIGAYEYQNPASLISYAWLQQYGLPVDGSADFTDSDNDGMNNWQEWICGTDPTDPASALRMLSPSNSPSGMVVNWQSVTNKTYCLQRGTDLRLHPAFSSIQSNIASQTGTTSFKDTNATKPGPYYYRVGVQQ